MRILTSQLRKAPSYSKVGGFCEAVILQFSTTSCARSGLPSTRHARKWGISWHRENRASNTADSCRRSFDIRIVSDVSNLQVVFTSMGSLLWISVTFSTYLNLPASILKSPLL